MAESLLVVDSITHLDEAARGQFVVCGSHGGYYAGTVAARQAVGAAIFNDAGVGRERAGLAGLDLLDTLQVPAGCVNNFSARIGDGHDTLSRGVLSHVNRVGARIGWTAGMSVARAVAITDGRALGGPTGPVPAVHEERKLLISGEPQAWALDSASLAREDDRGAVLITGSHGGLPGRGPRAALRVAARAAVFNDAGLGIDNAGVGRLPVLAGRGIAAVAVAAASARIGEGHSTYADGILSTVNGPASSLGACVGMTTVDFVQLVRDALGWPGRRDD